MGCFACFDGGMKQRRREEEQLASQEARARAAEAAQKRILIVRIKRDGSSLAIGDQELLQKVTKQSWIRQEQFDQSAAGRAAKAQMAAIAKQNANPNKGEPVLKWQMG